MEELVIPEKTMRDLVASMEDIFQVPLSRQSRLFQTFDGALIGLVPRDMSCRRDTPVSEALQAYLKRAHACQHAPDVFVAEVLPQGDDGQINKYSDEAIVFAELLWDAGQGIGAVLLHGNDETPDAIEVIGASDIRELLEVIFEPLGPEESPV